MFGKLFGKTSEKEKLQKQYEKMLKEAYTLSHTNRAQSDKLQAEAEALMKRIESL